MYMGINVAAARKFPVALNMLPKICPLESIMLTIWFCNHAICFRSLTWNLSEIICCRKANFSDNLTFNNGISSEKDINWLLRKNNNPATINIIKIILRTIAKVLGNLFDSNHRLTGINKNVNKIPRLTGIRNDRPTKSTKTIMMIKNM